MSTPPKHAVVLSGGGANAAYEIGVLKALVSGLCPTTNGEHLVPDIFLGTSAGAFNAAFLASKWDALGSTSILELENIWLEKLAANFKTGGNGVYELQGQPFQLLNPQSYIPDPFKPITTSISGFANVGWDSVQRLASLFTAQDSQLLDRVTNLVNFSSFVSIQPFRNAVEELIEFQQIRRSSRQLRIAATNWSQGETDIFNERDMADNIGADIILGSSAIPGIFPIQKIGSQPYVDGGVLMNSPLLPAIRAGANIIHVITLNPEVSKIPLTHMSNTLSTIWRQQVISWVKTIDSDIKRTKAINLKIELIQDALLHVPKDAKISFHPKAGEHKDNCQCPLSDALREETSRLRPITVYLYRPGDDLGGPLGLLDLRRDRLKELIERGFSDALDYQPTESTFVSETPLRHQLAEAHLLTSPP